MKALTIVKTELWQRRKALIWWSVGVAALISIDMLLYLSIKKDASNLNEIFSNLPSAFSALFADNADFISPAGFLSARVYFLLLPLLLTIFTIGAGTSLIGKEERQGTLELLLARPISRLKLLASKISAGAAAIGVLSFVALITAVVCLRPGGFDTISYKSVILVTANTVMLSSLFGALAFCLTAAGGKLRNSATAIAALAAFSGYLLSSLENLQSWLVWPARLLPYHYYDPNAILNGTSYGLKSLLGFGLITVALLIAAWAGFRRRDIG